MFNTDSESENLELLEAAAASPKEICDASPEVKEAFDQELRNLAEEIVQFHPSLTQLLLSLSDPKGNPVHGQN